MNPCGDGDWREQLKAVPRSYFQALHERPGLAQIALTTIPSGPNMTDLTERLLALLVAGGMDFLAPPGRSTCCCSTRRRSRRIPSSAPPATSSPPAGRSAISERSTPQSTE